MCICSSWAIISVDGAGPWRTSLATTRSSRNNHPSRCRSVVLLSPSFNRTFRSVLYISRSSSSSYQKHFWVDPLCIELKRFSGVLSFNFAVFYCFTCHWPFLVCTLKMSENYIRDDDEGHETKGEEAHDDCDGDGGGEMDDCYARSEL